MNLLQKHLQSYYSNWQSSINLDKQTTCLFLVFSGPGLGKSRLLQEFPRLATEAIPDTNSELKNLLHNAVKFNISFENGTAYLPSEGENPEKILGTRMMFLFSDDTDFGRFRQKYVNGFTVDNALDEIPNDIGSSKAVFLLLDGAQMLLKEGSEVSDSHQLLKSVVRYVCAKMINSVASTKLFIIPVVAATVKRPLENILWHSPQKRVFLSPHRIDGTKIISLPYPWVQTLIHYTGGHGRALEALLYTLQSFNVIENFDQNRQDLNFFSLFISTFRKYLLEAYPYWENLQWIPILKCIIARKPFNRLKDHVIPKISVEKALGLGLLTWNSGIFLSSVLFCLKKVKLTSKHTGEPLEAPFSLCMLISDSHLLSSFGATHKSLHFLLSNAATGLCRSEEGTNWRDFERLVAHLLCLKSEVFDNTKVTLEEFLYGAEMNDMAKQKEVEIHSRKYHEAMNRMEDKVQKGIQLSNDCVTLNAHGASAADILVSFNEFSLRVACRHRKEKLNRDNFLKELTKSFPNFNDNDCFVMCVTGKTQFKVQHEVSGCLCLISSDSFTSFFGPFVGNTFHESNDLIVHGDKNLNDIIIDSIENVGKKRKR
jgi:hypothetical protein